MFIVTDLVSLTQKHFSAQWASNGQSSDLHKKL